MEKVLLAVGHRQLEEYLEKQLRKEFLFVGTTVYREGVIRAIGQNKPDIVVIRETLDGRENIMTIIYEIRRKFPKVRIVFIAGKREAGDAFLASLVNYGVYDILPGGKVQANEVIALIRKPNDYKDVQHLQPVPVLDEQSNQMLFEAPDAVVREREIIKEVYIDSSDDNQNKGRKEPIHEQDQEKSEVQVQEPKAKDADAGAVVEREKERDQGKKQDPPVKVDEPKETTKATFLERLTSKSGISSDDGQKLVATTKQRIVTFVGSKDGVGNTSIAFNTALMLAKKGLKTIFLEFDDRTPSVSYWYELGHLEDGIDSAISALTENDFDKVEDAIVRTEVLKKSDSLMQKNYRKFPDALDFMFFSKRYLTRQADEHFGFDVDLSLSRELLLYLMFQMDYDYIILDVPPNIDHVVTNNALIYSNKVFITLSQDVSTIGYSIYKLNELTKKGINISKKLYYIVNKFEKADLSLKEIEDWIHAGNISTVPIVNKDFINANFLGLPVTLYSKNSGLRTAFEKIIKLVV